MGMFILFMSLVSLVLTFIAIHILMSNKAKKAAYIKVIEELDSGKDIPTIRAEFLKKVLDMDR